VTLPASVIKKDDELEAALGEAGNTLMEHRWHWTLDMSNPKRVPVREYARTVGKAYTTIRADVQGWADYLASQSDRARAITPGKAGKPEDFRELAKLSTQKQHAAEAIARSTGRSVNAAARDRDAIKAVVSSAQERAERKGTTVDAEIEESAAFREKARISEEKQRADRKKRRTTQFIKVEGDIGVAMSRLRRVLDESDGIDWDEDEQQLLTDAIAKLKALLNLVELRIIGSVDVDWDGELSKITAN
jgi:hypothetical protein